MKKTVIVFHEKQRLGAFPVTCEDEPGARPMPKSSEDFEAACRDHLIATGALTAEQAGAAKYVVQD